MEYWQFRTRQWEVVHWATPVLQVIEIFHRPHLKDDWPVAVAVDVNCLHTRRELVNDACARLRVKLLRNLTRLDDEQG